MIYAVDNISEPLVVALEYAIKFLERHERFAKPFDLCVLAIFGRSSLTVFKVLLRLHLVNYSSDAVLELVRPLTLIYLVLGNIVFDGLKRKEAAPA